MWQLQRRNGYHFELQPPEAAIPLEEDGIVESEWSGDLPGPAKRTYTLTESGGRVLDQCHADAFLREIKRRLEQFHF